MADDDEVYIAEAEAEAEAADERVEVPTAIVGIGVSTASLPSLVALFGSLVPGSGAAFLVAAHQTETVDVATVQEALGPASALPVSLATDGVRIDPDRVYLAAPDDLLTIEDGHLRARSAADPVGRRGAIDSLLVSLAEHAHERAVAVLLAGLGSEGAAGMVATKKFGGLSIAEEDSRTGQAVQGGSNPGAVADLHLPVDRIAGEINRYLKSLGPILKEGEREETSGELERHITQITTILRNVTSHDFHGYKRGTFVRRVQRRIQVMQIDGGMEAYIERLRADREEVQLLFQDLLIGVTQFFRDPAEFETLERELPRLFAGKEAGDQFRVWVLGCATGEEAYSIAILLREYMATLDHPPEVQIFATDLDARALSLARAGRYAETIASHVRPDRLERWFVREGDTFVVTKELREMCIFSPHNIVKDAPFSRTDILSCRNLLIYLSTDLQNRVIPIFHFSLRPEGVLFLGSSENVTRHGKLFAPVDRKSRVFRRLETATRIIPDFPLTPRARGGGEPMAAATANSPFEARLPPSVSRQADAIAERYAPAHVVVDSHGDVLHFSGRTGRYLEPSAGAATLNLANLVHRDLRLDVRTALGRAITEARRVEIPRLTLRQDDRAFAVNVIVEPLSTGDVTALVIIFQDLGSVAEGAADADRLTSDEHVQRLEAELRITRDRLQATIEELESTNEELKSSNEEYQSINEELQSANEEMETSKEELQSVNEELQTVNGELAHRVQDLGRANSDMKNLLESTQIATVFLDNGLRIRNFTPAATDIFHLLETDIGRPLDHVVSRVSYPELIEDVRRVLKTLVPIERQVSDTAAEKHFSARVLPYRSVDNYISGAVATFTDLTDVRHAEVALRESDARRMAMADAAPALVWETDEGGVTFVNQHYLDFLGVGFERVKGLGWIDFVHPDDREAYLADYAIAFAERQPLEHSIRLLRADGEYRWTQSTGRPLGENRFVGLSLDVTEAKAAEGRLRETEERFRQFGEASQDVLWIRDAATLQWEYLTPAFETIYGMSRDAALRGDNMAGWLELIVPEDREGATSSLQRVRDGEWVTFEYRIRRPIDNEIRWLQSTDFPIRNDAGTVVRIGGIGHDVTELKRTEEALAAIESRQRALVEGIPQLVWRAAADGEWTWASPQWTEFTGQAEPESLGWGWLEPLHPEDRQKASEVWASAAARGGLDVKYRIRDAARSDYRWFHTRASPVRDDRGRIVEWLGTSTDVDNLRLLQERQQVLVTELQHRTFNLMAVVRSMADATVRTSDSLDDFSIKFRDRIDALARVQRLLSSLKEGDRITFDALIRSELTAAGALARDDGRVSLEGPADVALRSGTVQTFAMAIHELTTNALKYGALRQPEAHLDVRWHLRDDSDEQPWLHVAWTETGVEMPSASTSPTGTGQGRTLIEEALPYQLQATTTYELAADGVRCTIALPLPPVHDPARDEANA